MVSSRLYREYGGESEQFVRSNPYIVALPEYGAKFEEADALAKLLGFPENSTERIEAAVLYELRHNLGNGHVFIPAGTLAEASAVFLNKTRQSESVNAEETLEVIDYMSESALIDRDVIKGIDACYLPEYFQYETESAEILKRLSDAVDPLSTETINNVISKIEKRNGVVYAEGQRQAVALAARNRVITLTGGPGTGKTTTVNAILDLFEILGLKTLLCAPTGRAAKRMNQLTGRDASTIHRMLGAIPGADDELAFQHDADFPLDCGAVIVDEASMLDLPLAHALLAALPNECRIVFVGDENQLPSVGAGNVLGDIIKSGLVPTVTLTEIFRQAEGSSIVRAAHAVNRGESDILSGIGNDMFFMRRQTADAVSSTVCELVSKRLPDKLGIPDCDIQVLTPTKRGNAGTRSLNAALREVCNPKSAGKNEHKRGETLYRVGDRVMQIRNNYDIEWRGADGTEGLGMFNGDMGVITRIDPALEQITVDFEDKIVEYDFGQLDDLEPAFAVTVHKAQGSEFRAVVLALPPGIGRLAVRCLLYTAITRAKEMLVVVGSSDVWEEMVANNTRSKRFSGLRYRLARKL